MRNPFARRRGSADPFDSATAQEGPRMESIGPTIQYTWEADPGAQQTKKGKGVGRIVKKLNCANRDRIRLEQLEQDQIDSAASAWKPEEEYDESDWKAVPTSYGLPTCTSIGGDYMKVGNGWSDPTAAIPNKDRYIPSKATERLAYTSGSSMRDREQQERPLTTAGASVRGRVPMSVRKERWRKGLQSQRGFPLVADQGTTGSGDESISFQTGGSTASYSDTDCTTENSSDDSEVGFRHTSRGRSKSTPPTRTASRSGSRKPKSNSKKSASNDDGDNLWANVAEDLGILAGLLLSDGKACVGSVSDIARETVTEPCRGDTNSRTITRRAVSSSRRSMKPRHRVPDNYMQ